LGPITIPASVTNIGNGAFQVCYRLQALYFEGDAPYFGEFLFQAADNETLYYLPGKQGWEVPSVRYPSSLWRPEMVPVKINTRPETNQFGFYIHWARGMNVTIETCTNLTAPAWVPLQTNTLSSSLDYFTDAGGQTLPGRFYRLRWPESTQ